MDITEYFDSLKSNFINTGVNSLKYQFKTPDGYKFTITIEKINKGV